jgi:hypothetical protein
MAGERAADGDVGLDLESTHHRLVARLRFPPFEGVRDEEPLVLVGGREQRQQLIAQPRLAEAGDRLDGLDPNLGEFARQERLDLGDDRRLAGVAESHQGFLEVRQGRGIGFEGLELLVQEEGRGPIISAI